MNKIMANAISRFRMIIVVELLFTPLLNAGEVAVLPSPYAVEYQDGLLNLNKNDKIILPGDATGRLVETAELLNDGIRSVTGFSLQLYKGDDKLAGVSSAPVSALAKLKRYYNRLVHHARMKLAMDSGIYLEIKSNPQVKAEGYVLKVAKSGITIEGGDDAGVFYGTQTLRQLLCRNGNAWQLPFMTLTDYPQFSWRGNMVDPARQFRDVTVLKAIMDVMARYKMNVFHIHFTDDSSWTLQSDKYPKLTTYRNPPAGPYGSYTKADLREIIEYGRKRFITIVPEIDVPAHAAALIGRTDYPSLLCDHKPNLGVVCAGKDKTYTVVGDLIDEFAPLFPGAYFHVGADEVWPTNNWEKCVSCKMKMKKENLDPACQEQLYGYFLRALQDMLKKHNKRMIAWEEASSIGPQWLGNDAIFQKWKGSDANANFLRIAGEKGFKIINSTSSPLYLCRFGNDAIDLIDFQPRIFGSMTAFSNSVLGIESCSWGDRKEMAEDKVLMPRLLAVAERSWAEKTERGAFMRRMTYQFLDTYKQIPSELCGKPDAAGMTAKLIEIIADQHHPLNSFRMHLLNFIVNDHPDLVAAADIRDHIDSFLKTHRDRKVDREATELLREDFNRLIRLKKKFSAGAPRDVSDWLDNIERTGLVGNLCLDAIRDKKLVDLNAYKADVRKIKELSVAPLSGDKFSERFRLSNTPSFKNLVASVL